MLPPERLPFAAKPAAAKPAKEAAAVTAGTNTIAAMTINGETVRVTNATPALNLMAVLNAAMHTLVSPQPEQILELEGWAAHCHSLRESSGARLPEMLTHNEVAALCARRRSLAYLLDYTAAHLATIKRLNRRRTLPAFIFSSSAGEPGASTQRIRYTGGRKPKA